MAKPDIHRCPNCGTRLSKGLVEAIKDPEREERCNKVQHK